MNETKNLRLRLTDDNSSFLTQVNKKTNIPKNKIINIVLSETRREEIEQLEFIDDETPTAIKFNITATEKNFLKNEMEKSGAGNITNEIKYRLLNTINKNVFFTSNELVNFTKASYELNMIGRNLNQLVKKLNQKEELVDTQDIKDTVKEIDSKIKEMSKEFKQVITNTNDRF